MVTSIFCHWWKKRVLELESCSLVLLCLSDKNLSLSRLGKVERKITWEAKPKEFPFIIDKSTFNSLQKAAFLKRRTFQECIGSRCILAISQIKFIYQEGWLYQNCCFVFCWDFLQLFDGNFGTLFSFLSVVLVERKEIGF